jgi:23S rRNA (uracil1939-C5)-methyltransferase
MTNDPEQQISSLPLTDMAYGGDAVGRDPQSGVKVFAWPAIQGEEVSVRVTGRNKNLLRGVVEDISTVSPSRTIAPCPYFGTCGGCQWQHIDYAAQVEFKHNILRSQLSRLGGIADPDAFLQPPIPSPTPYNYRNTSHFALDPSAYSLAYYKRETHQLIPVAQCPISNQGINRVMTFVNGLLAGSFSDVAPLPIDARGVMHVWKITIRAGEATGHTLIIFHSLAGGADPRPRLFPHRGRRAPAKTESTGKDVASVVGDEPQAAQVISLQRRAVRRAIGELSNAAGLPSALLAIEIMADGTINRLGETRGSTNAASEAMADAISGGSLAAPRLSGGEADKPPIGAWIERLGKQTYWVGPTAFFQTNTPAAELMLTEIQKHLPPKMDMLIDAHAGVGTFALAFAKRAKYVLAFEPEPGAVSSGQWTARSSHIPNVEFHKGTAEALLPNLQGDIKPQVIILDPPRNGCHPALLTEIISRKIPRLIYVSCDPSTLARDIKLLAPSYKVTSARVLDIFPQTYHIETIAVLDLL